MTIQSIYDETILKSKEVYEKQVKLINSIVNLVRNSSNDTFSFILSEYPNTDSSVSELCVKISDSNNRTNQIYIKLKDIPELIEILNEVLKLDKMSYEEIIEYANKKDVAQKL